MKDIDRELTCRQCGKQFLFTAGEQEFYERKGFSSPNRCPECRPNRQNQPQYLVCSQCGTELEKGTSIYCTACLASVHLEFELRTEQAQRDLDEAQSKLAAIESEKVEVEKSLRQNEQLVAQLKQKVNSLNQDLENSHQFHAVLGWSQEALTGIEERLGALEQAQNKTNQRMLQLVQKIHEMYEKTSLLELIKRGFSNLVIDQKTQKEKSR